jgi:beta-aspartyl-dipeptidase (metallo-type)
MLQRIRGGRVWTPEDRGLADVWVAGSQVAHLGDLPPPPAGWPIEDVDAQGMWVLPGLIDAHVHLAGGGGEGGAHTRIAPLQDWQLTTAGVTTAIGLLGTDGTTRTIADLLAVARGLAHHGLTALCYTGSYEVPPVTLTGSVRGDIVHVDRIVAAGEVAISDHRSSQPTFEELTRIAADCHVAGLMTGKAGCLHLHLGDGPRGLSLVWRALDETELPARVFHPTHVNRNPALWAEAQALSRRGVAIDVTAFPPDDTDPAIAPDRAIAAFLADGGDPARLTLSSDGGGCLPTFDRDGNLLAMDVGTSATLLPAIAGAIRAGVSPTAALATATANPAAQLRLAGKGRLRPGGDADLVIATPDLVVRDVLAGGRWLVRDGRAIGR